MAFAAWYMASRHVQKSSCGWSGSTCSTRPLSALWKAWLWAFTKPGRRNLVSAMRVSSQTDVRGIQRTVRVVVRRAGRDRAQRGRLEPVGLEPTRGRGASLVLAHGYVDRARGAAGWRRELVGGHRRRRPRALGVHRVAPGHTARRRRLRRGARGSGGAGGGSGGARVRRRAPA